MEIEFFDFVEFAKSESLKFPKIKHFFRCFLAYLSIYSSLNENYISDKRKFVRNVLDISFNLKMQSIYFFFDFDDFTTTSRYLLDNEGWWKFIPVLNRLEINPYHLSYYHESLTADESKKSSGGYFSPREQVDFICKCSLYEFFRTDDTLRIGEGVLFQLIFQGRTNTLQRHEIMALLDKIRILRILDPSCGCGTFLFEMGQNIVFILNSLLRDNFITYSEFLETLEGCLSNIKGFDIDFYNVKITELSLIFLWNSQIRDDSSSNKQINEFNLRPNADILTSDFLENKTIKDNTIDICCTNPPFIRHHKFDKNKIIRFLKDNPELIFAFKEKKVNIDAKGDIYLYFIIKTLILLKPKGVFGFILSRSWYSSRFSSLLYQLMNNKYFWMKLIVETPYEPWQKAEVRTNIVIAQKHSGKFSNDITSLLVWKRSIQGLLQGYIDLVMGVTNTPELVIQHSGKYQITSKENHRFYFNQINDAYSLIGLVSY
jgi:hypothetical protein